MCRPLKVITSVFKAKKMSELLIEDKKLPLCNNKNKNQQQNISITEVLSSTDGCFSLELCPDRNLDIQLLSTLNTGSCSIPWFLPRAPGCQIIVEEIPALKLAEQLYGQGYNITLHLAARNLNENIVLNILNNAKNIGIRNILALQGGLYIIMILFLVIFLLLCYFINGYFYI